MFIIKTSNNTENTVWGLAPCLLQVIYKSYGYGEGNGFSQIIEVWRITHYYNGKTISLNHNGVRKKLHIYPFIKPRKNIMYSLVLKYVELCAYYYFLVYLVFSKNHPYSYLFSLCVRSAKVPTGAKDKIYKCS